MYSQTQEMSGKKNGRKKIHKNESILEVNRILT